MFEVKKIACPKVEPAKVRKLVWMKNYTLKRYDKN